MSDNPGINLSVGFDSRDKQEQTTGKEYSHRSLAFHSVALPGGVQLCFASYLRSETGGTGAGGATDAKPQLPIAWRAAGVNRPMQDGAGLCGFRMSGIRLCGIRILHVGIGDRLQAVAHIRSHQGWDGNGGRCFTGHRNQSIDTGNRDYGVG